LLAHISIGEEERIILDRSFKVRPEFQISSKLGYTQQFSILLSGAVVKGQIIFSDKSLLVNVLFAGSLSLITILSILFFKWFQNNRIGLAVARSQADLAKQIRHDIASPLSALNMIVSLLQNVPEPQRVILRKSVKRIHDIANQLSSVGKPVSDMVTQNERARVPSLATELLSPLIDEMVSEKRVQYREKQYVEIDVDLSRGYGLFSKINPVEFKRVLSNLINNAFEALLEEKGEITIAIERLGSSSVAVRIKDNGKGIPEHMLEKLGRQGISYGKEHLSSGSGLGLYHAKQTVESFYGELKIQSSEGKGTTVTIILPLAPPPCWFLEKLLIQQNSYLISLDDDGSVHSVYAQRFEELEIGHCSIKHLKFASGNEFKRWVLEHRNERVLFLCDFELIGQPQNGLDLIEELGIADAAILVTSRFEEPLVRDRCNRLGVRIVPKRMISYVPIEVVTVSATPLPNVWIDVASRSESGECLGFLGGVSGDWETVTEPVGPKVE